MDVIIPITSQNEDDGWIELRYALRSLKHIYTSTLIGGEVHLVGSIQPKWYKGKFHQYSEPRNFEHREQNMIQKLTYAAHNFIDADNDGGLFLYMHDDHFMLPDFNPFLWPSISVFGGNGPYQNTVQRTKEAFGANIRNFDMHCPCVMHRDKVVHMWNAHDWTKPYAQCIKTTYAYMFNPPNQVNGIGDLKINLATDIFHLRGMVKDRTFFSTDKGAFRGQSQIEMLLDELYPNKSMWEI